MRFDEEKTRRSIQGCKMLLVPQNLMADEEFEGLMAKYFDVDNQILIVYPEEMPDKKLINLFVNFAKRIEKDGL